MVIMRALDIKLFRDLQRLWAQALAISLVVAGGTAALVGVVGSIRSLEETRDTYYERYQFADVFAQVKRAPKTLIDRIAEIPGVATIDARIVRLALLDISDSREPVTAQFISLPDDSEQRLNRIYLRTGRTPEPGRADEAVVYEAFADAHNMSLGSRFSAILNGRKQELVVVGTALSPEFIYTIAPGETITDNRRFGIVWMSEKALGAAYNLDGAFSSVTLKLLRNASELEVIKRLDALLDPYGGQAAYGRKDLPSHAWGEHGLDMLRNMARTMPTIFLLVAAFLINQWLNRMVALEREQIGLLKALGYRNIAIAAHYFKFAIALIAVGTIIGAFAGTWLGAFITRMYGTLIHFPFLIFIKNSDVYVMGALVSLLAGTAGAVRALQAIVGLPPAVAMQPPAPPRFRRMLPPGFAINRLISQPTRIMLRNLSHHPLRAACTILGMALATAIIIVSLFLQDTVEDLINVTYFIADRHDATVSFVEKRPQSVVEQIAHLPGVLTVEPYRQVPVRIRYQNVERRIMIGGRPRDADLRRVIDVHLRSVALPENGLAISAWLAQLLGVQIGDFVDVDLLEGQRRTVSLPVAALVEDFFGIQGMMDLESLNRLMREGPTVSAVSFTFDAHQADLLYAAVKSMPAVAGIGIQRFSLANYRTLLAPLQTNMAMIYTGFAIIIAFGVVYSSARISLSERARELASLRVLGFGRGEVLFILLIELGLLTVLAQPLGWLLGYVLSGLLKAQVSGEVMRARLVVENASYTLASGIVIIAALLSALVVRERINRLDLVAVLKTRD
jgi:putative ABC transport system permease protein